MKQTNKTYNIKGLWQLRNKIIKKMENKPNKQFEDLKQQFEDLKKDFKKKENSIKQEEIKTNDSNFSFAKINNNTNKKTITKKNEVVIDEDE